MALNPKSLCYPTRCPMPATLGMETGATAGLSESLSCEDAEISLSLDKSIDSADRGFIRRAVL